MNAVKVPPTVQAMLAARIDRLPAEEKELLQTLAVIGREFPLALVRRGGRASRTSELGTRGCSRSASWGVHLRAAGDGRR